MVSGVWCGSLPSAHRRRDRAMGRGELTFLPFDLGKRVQLFPDVVDLFFDWNLQPRGHENNRVGRRPQGLPEPNEMVHIDNGDVVRDIGQFDEVSIHSKWSRAPWDSTPNGG